MTAQVPRTPRSPGRWQRANALLTPLRNPQRSRYDNQSYRLFFPHRNVLIDAMSKSVVTHFLLSSIISCMQFPISLPVLVGQPPPTSAKKGRKNAKALGHRPMAKRPLASTPTNRGRSWWGLGITSPHATAELSPNPARRQAPVASGMRCGNRAGQTCPRPRLR